MAESVLAEMSDPQNKILAISHCNCPERAEAVKEQLVKHATFKDVIVWIWQESVVCMLTTAVSS